MVMSATALETEDAPANQKVKTVGMYPEDIAAVERIRTHYGLDGFGQAVRRAIRVLAKVVEEERSEKERAA
jgi:hypothetical protein